MKFGSFGSNGCIILDKPWGFHDRKYIENQPAGHRPTQLPTAGWGEDLDVSLRYSDRAGVLGSVTPGARERLG